MDTQSLYNLILQAVTYTEAVASVKLKAVFLKNLRFCIWGLKAENAVFVSDTYQITKCDVRQMLTELEDTFQVDLQDYIGVLPDKYALFEQNNAEWFSN